MAARERVCGWKRVLFLLCGFHRALLGVGAWKGVRPEAGGGGSMRVARRQGPQLKRRLQAVDGAPWT